MPYIVRDKNTGLFSKRYDWVKDPNEAKVFRSEGAVKISLGRSTPNPKRERVRQEFADRGETPRYWDLPMPFRHMILADHLEIIEITFKI